jgi:hypothetical protein
VRGGRAFSGYGPVPLARARFPPVDYFPCTPLCCFLVNIRTFIALPMCLSEVYCHVSGAGSRFLPPFHKGNYPGSCLARHSCSIPIVFGPFTKLGAIGSPIMFLRPFFFSWLPGARPATRGPALEPHSLFSLLPAGARFLWQGLLPHRPTPFLPPCLYCSGCCKHYEST